MFGKVWIQRGNIYTFLYDWIITHSFPEPKEWRSVVWEDAEATQGPEPSCHHPGDDQEEGEKQAWTAAPHTGDCGEAVRKTSVWNWAPDTIQNPTKSLAAAVKVVCTASTTLLGN